MFEYMRQKDKAELRGNVKTLEDVLEAYRYNWNNDIWRKNAHMKVVGIKQETEKAIIHLRAQIRTKMGEKSPVELRLAVGGRLDKVLDRLKEYQLATYTYSFAAFLEPMLSENFDEANLDAIAAKIGDRVNEYRELYTECYNAIEESSKGAADAVALRGASAAFAGLGAFVKQTPLGERTSVDEALAARELIKISVRQNCLDDPRQMAEVLAERTHSEVVQVIGRKIVLYKEGKDDKKKIVLP